MTVSTTSNKVSFSANGSTTVFAYNFKIFADADLTVIIRAADGTETTKTLTTHYTVSGAGSSSGGNVTFTSGNTPANGETVVIQRKLTLTQGTDYVANDPFPAESHEDALDRLTFITQQIQEEVDRSIKASVTNTISGATFTLSASDRANKVFAFDSSGDLAVTQEIGTFRGNWAAGTAYNQRDLVKDTSTNNIFIVNTAHTSSGAQPLTTNANSAKYDLIVDAASATSSATNAASSATAAATSATAAATSATASATAQTASETAQTASETAKTASETAKTAAETALDTFTDIFLGAKSSDPSVDNDGDALQDGALVFNTTDNVLKVYDLGNTQWNLTAPNSTNQGHINTVSGIQANVTTVAGISSNVTSVAGISSDVTSVAGIASDVTAVAGDATDIGAVAGKATEIGRLGTAAAVADLAILGTTDAVSDMNTLAAISSNISTVAGVSSDVTTVAGISANATTVAGISANVTTVAGISSDVTTVAGNNANVTTVAGANSNITSVAGSISNVNTVATNLSSINDFADKYRIGATDPTTNNDEGDLFYNTTSNTLKVFTGSAFEAGVTAGSGFAALSGANFTGAVDVDDTLTANTIALDNGSNDWSVTVTSNNLIFSYAGTAKMKVDSSGNLTVTGDVISEGTI